MPISYPITPPAEFRSAHISLLANAVVGWSESPYTLSEQVYVHQGQRLEMTIKFPPMKRDRAEPLIGFLNKLNSSEGSLYLGDTANKLPRGLATGTPLTKGISTARSTELATDGWTPSITVLKAGDWIQVGTGSTRRLHKLDEDAVSNGAGEATLVIWPRTRSAYADNTSIVTSSPTGVFRMRGPCQWEIDTAKIYSVSASFVESIS